MRRYTIQPPQKHGAIRPAALHSGKVRSVHAVFAAEPTKRCVCGGPLGACRVRQDRIQAVVERLTHCAQIPNERL